VPTDKKSTGQRLDDTGLYYHGARYYDAGIGRFISADIIGQRKTRMPGIFLMVVAVFLLIYSSILLCYLYFKGGGKRKKRIPSKEALYVCIATSISIIVWGIVGRLLDN